MFDDLNLVYSDHDPSVNIILAPPSVNIGSTQCQYCFTPSVSYLNKNRNRAKIGQKMC